jgi:lysozyme
MPEQPSAAPSRAPRKSLLALAVGVACASIVAPFVSTWESGGKQHLVAYHGTADAPGIWTICDGDTLGVKLGDRETPEGCSIRIDRRLTSFVKPVLMAAPTLKGHPYQLAASISLAYNIGAANFASSTVARRFRAGDWVGACTAFAMWNRANGKVVAGLVNRRTAEMKLCLTDLPR